MYRRLALAVTVIVGVSSSCIGPDKETGLASFAATFPNPDKSSDVVVSEPMVLDVGMVDVNTIKIQGTGKLVFSDDIDIVIKTKGIWVTNKAALVIGSDACRHRSNVNIILQGMRTTERSSLPFYDEKYIAVNEEGVLDIHGKDKLAWTKLSETVERFQKNRNNVEYLHSWDTSGNFNAEDWGLSVLIFNDTYTNPFQKTYNFKLRSYNKIAKQRDDLLNRLENLNSGDVVAISIQRAFKVHRDLDMTDVYQKLEDAAGLNEGELLLRQSRVDGFDAFALIFVKDGVHDQRMEKMYGTWTASVSASIVHDTFKFTSVCKTSLNVKVIPSSIDVRVLADGGFPVISVIDDISSWEEGDEVLLTSTDYAWNHHEVRKIKEKINSHTIMLSEELEYRHYGEIEQGVDMRGEVALLTRNIQIEGEMLQYCPVDHNENCANRYVLHDTYGGHIMMNGSFGSVFIEGTQLTNMGQATDKGHYPVHFHMCGNITGKTAVVKRNAIRHSYARATTIHGTYGTSEMDPGVQIIENVAFDILGHAYFTEDGAEIATVFRGNLGAYIRPIQNGFVTDVGKTTVFWITNPKVVIVDNVACGSFSFGIWYTFPASPVGLSKSLGVYRTREAKRTALWRFDNNVVHSNRRGGLNFDNILLNENGRINGCMAYASYVNPLDRRSLPAKSQFTRLTAYKHRTRNVWIRGGWLEMIQFSSADSRKGIQVARSSDQQVFIKKSIFLGKTGNSEDIEPDYPDAYLPNNCVGFVFHDGPTYIASSWFNNFQPDLASNYHAAALGFVAHHKLYTSTVANSTDLRFGFTDNVDGVRLYNGVLSPDLEGIGDFLEDEEATFRDADGSVSKCPGLNDFQGPRQIVAPSKVTLTDRCVYRENWELLACADLYAKLSMVPRAYFDDQNNVGFTEQESLVEVQTRRLRYDGSGSPGYETQSARQGRLSRTRYEFSVLQTNDEYFYQSQLIGAFPKTLSVGSLGMEHGGHFVVGICMPEGTTREDFTIKAILSGSSGSIQDEDMVMATTLDAVKAGENTGANIYLEDRILYMKISSDTERDTNWATNDYGNCAGFKCPSYMVDLNTHRAYTPCFRATEEDLSVEGLLDNVPRLECHLPSSQPDVDWGRGDTFADQDGKYGMWTSWSDCDCEGNREIPCSAQCDDDGPETSSRYRVCDDPPPYGGGADCVGPSTEEKACPACPGRR